MCLPIGIMIDGPKIKLEDFGGLRSDHDASSYYCICVPSWQLFVLVSSSCLRRKKNKRFGTDGISLCLDSFQNAISSVMAVVHVIRNKEEPPLLRFRGINGNVQSACSNVLLA